MRIPSIYIRTSEATMDGTKYKVYEVVMDLNDTLYLLHRATSREQAEEFDGKFRENWEIEFAKSKNI